MGTLTIVSKGILCQGIVHMYHFYQWQGMFIHLFFRVVGGL